MVEPIVFVIDDDETSRESICALVESMNIPTESFDSGESFLNSYTGNRPGCVVTDIRMPGMSGVELQEKLRESGFSIPTVVVTAYATTPVTVKAMQNGAITLLEKPYNDQALWDAIRKALAEDQENRDTAELRAKNGEKLQSLTSDERRVLDGILSGKPNKTIAAELDVSVRTVESRRHNVFKKTETESIAELVRFVMTTEGEDRSQAPEVRPATGETC